MQKLVECIPNFSEGRRIAVIDQLIAAIKSISGVVILDRESDVDHNRSVITFVGSPARVVDAAVAAAKTAAELIDLNNHTGEHPRMGATDVIPFVPIRGLTMEDCAGLARQCAERIWNELSIPVYLYEKAATRPERENLAALRKGQFEGIREEIEAKSDRWPDFGDHRVHPTAGITAVGARPPLIAYNINLGTSDIEIANKISRAVRHQSGGLRYVKALGFELKERGIVQVSMNMVNYEGTPLFRVFELVKREAERYGVPVVGSEIVGLVPQGALDAASDFYLQLEHFSQNQILERRLQSAAEEQGAAQIAESIGEFSELVAAGTPTPGGGSVAAYCAMLAASLGRLMCNITVGRPKFSQVENEVKEIHTRLERLGGRFRELINEDAASFDRVLASHRLPKETDEQKLERQRQIAVALRGSVTTPLELAGLGVDLLRMLDRLRGVANPNALPDVTMGAKLALAAIRGALYNIAINVTSCDDREWVDQVREEAVTLVDEAETLTKGIEDIFFASVGWSNTAKEKN